MEEWVGKKDKKDGQMNLKGEERKRRGKYRLEVGKEAGKVRKKQK